MSSNDQQINNQLNLLEQQEESSHRLWLLLHTARGTVYPRTNDYSISQWINPNLDQIPTPSNKFHRYLNNKEKPVVKKSIYLIEEEVNGNFCRYGCQNKELTHNYSLTNKVNLRLPAPTLVQEQQVTSLPFIKKASVPVHFRNGQKKKQSSIQERTRYPLRLPQDPGMRDYSYRKGRLMGAARRPLRQASFSLSNATERSSVPPRIRLNDCITFIK